MPRPLPPSGPISGWRSSERWTAFPPARGRCSSCTTWRGSSTRRSRRCWMSIPAPRGRSFTGRGCCSVSSSPTEGPNMSDQFTEQLSPYLDGELDDLRRARLEAHLAGCAECAAVLADLRAIVAAAPEYPGREPEADLWPEIEARLETERRKDGRTTEGRKDGKTEGDDVPTVRRSV